MILGSILAAPLSDRLGRRLACVLGVGVTLSLAYLLFSWPVSMVCDQLYTVHVYSG